MTSEAMKRAKQKYQQQSVKRVPIEFNRTTEADLIEHLDKQPNKKAYIKGLIQEDMKNYRAKE